MHAVLALTKRNSNDKVSRLWRPVTAAVSVGTGVAASFGDGVVRFNPGEPPIAIEAHRGAVSCCAEGIRSVLTGGDDGRFLCVSPDGIKEIATFGTRWVDCVATASGHFACSSGSVALVWRVDDTDFILLEHPSTVGGLAFDAKARRLLSRIMVAPLYGNA